MEFSEFYIIFAALNLNRCDMKAQIMLVLLVVSVSVRAQTGHPWERYLNEVMTAEDSESESWERTYDMLCELEQHPLDINTVTRGELEELPFLTSQQIEELMEYQYRYGPMKSVAELQMIRSLDYAQRRLLTYFIYIDEQEVADGRQKVRMKDALSMSARATWTAIWATRIVTGCAISSLMAIMSNSALWVRRMPVSLSSQTATAGAMTITRCISN